MIPLTRIVLASLTSPAISEAEFFHYGAMPSCKSVMSKSHQTPRVSITSRLVCTTMLPSQMVSANMLRSIMPALVCSASSFRCSSSPQAQWTLTRSSPQTQVKNGVTMMEADLNIALEAIMEGLDHVTPILIYDWAQKPGTASGDVPSSYPFHALRLSLFWKPHNHVVILLHVSYLFLPVTRVFQRFVFSQEQHCNKIDKLRLDCLRETEDHRNNVKRLTTKEQTRPPHAFTRQSLKM